MSTSLTIGSSAAEEMLHRRVTNMIMLLDGALTIEKESNSPMVRILKGVGLNMAMLPWEMLYL